jgi:hypothetical protein
MIKKPQQQQEEEKEEIKKVNKFVFLVLDYFTKFLFFFHEINPLLL